MSRAFSRAAGQAWHLRNDTVSVSASVNKQALWAYCPSLSFHICKQE